MSTASPDTTPASQLIKVADTPAARVLQLVEVTDAAMQKAAAFQETVMQKQAAVDAAIPGVVKQLCESKLMREGEVKQAMAALRDHGATIGLLSKLAARHAATAAGVPAIGSGGPPVAQQPVKRASETGRGRSQSASAALFAGLGLPVPSDLT